MSSTPMFEAGPPGAGRRRGASLRVVLVAVAVGAVLADSSIVTLGLPEILRDFDATVADVAWVLISFNVVLALAPFSAVHRGNTGSIAAPA